MNVDSFNDKPHPLSRTSMLLIGHREYCLFHFTGDFCRALETTFELEIHYVEDVWPHNIDQIPNYRTFDVVLWFVHFRVLVKMPPINWCDYQGMRILYDTDAVQNFVRYGNNNYLGQWEIAFHQNHFDFLVCTGKRTAEKFNERGIKALWLPKACNPERLFDKNGNRSGIGYFGSPYLARKKMLSLVEANGFTVNCFRSTYEELNDHLNRYLACLVCNYGGYHNSRFAPLLRLWIPDFSLVLTKPVEPMAKNFEISCTGCAPIADWSPDLDALGFVDGQNIVTYSSFNKLLDKLSFYLDSPELLRDIGKNSAQFVKRYHSWQVRARQLGDAIASLRRQNESARNVATANYPDDV